MAETLTTEELIKSARIRMLLQLPFYGVLAARLKMVDASKWLPTAATDGKHLYYSDEFFSKLTRDNAIFVIAHEVLHCAYQHVGKASRLGNRNPTLWNVAADFVINLELKRAGVGTPPGQAIGFDDIMDAQKDAAKDPKAKAAQSKQGHLLDHRFEGMSAEEVYKYIDDNLPKQNREILVSVGFDRHVGGANDDGSGGDKQDPSGKEGPCPISAEEAQDIDDDLKDAVYQAAKEQMQKGGDAAGNIPGDIRRMVDELENPQIDWRDVLRNAVTSIFQDRYSFQSMRKSWDPTIRMPASVPGEAVSVCVAIDYSGSISDDELREFLSEVRGMVQGYDDFDLRIWGFDTKVDHKHVARITPHNLDDMMEEVSKITAGGGTRIESNWEFMKRYDIEPDQLVVITDGYNWSDEWGDPDYCETIFLINNTEVTAPFGRTLRFTMNADAEPA